MATKYIWEGCVGISIQPKQNTKTGEEFFSYRFHRFGGEDINGQRKYYDSFSPRDNENLGKALSRAMHFMASTNPSQLALDDMKLAA